jgi:uncharacterized membrane protein
MLYLWSMQRFNPKRLTTLDTLRGFAMLWMTVYHLCFDLNHFGWMSQDFYSNPLWTWQRSAIVSLFLFCAGWSQALAKPSYKLPTDKPVVYFSWKRWLQIALCAAAVSASSYVMYPKSFIYFGVLHGVCVMLLMLWGLRFVCTCYLPGALRWQRLLFAALGAVCLVLFMYPPVIFNAAPLSVLGFISQKPITEDYVPLLPWFACVCWGYAFGLWHQNQPEVVNRAINQVINQAKKKGLNTRLNPLSALGQYSLSYYMLHQPVLIGLLYLLNLGRLT